MNTHAHLTDHDQSLTTAAGDGTPARLRAAKPVLVARQAERWALNARRTIARLL